MTRTTSPRVSTGLFAALFCVILSACSGGGTTTPLPQTQPGQQHAGGPVQQQPSFGASASTESIVRDTTPATESFSYSKFTYHTMPVLKSGSSAASSKKTIPETTIYPDDLYNYGGPVAQSVTFHNVYLDCSTGGATCWGNPYQFLNDLGHSSMIHLLDQYDGTVSLNAGKSYGEARALYANTVYDNDLLRYLHHAIYKLGGAGATGLTNLYNIFLPPGVDTCFDQTSTCYSPDNPANFAFCAYHGAVQYSDFGVVLFTVEPFQGVAGCGYPAYTGNLDSATANVLSHETFETMSDPIPPSGWLGNAGEIGDECAWFSITPETLNGRTYNIQLEYSNAVHGCSDQPTGAPAAGTR